MTDVPLDGDRAAKDAASYPTKHTNDTDTATGIHHTLGLTANKAMPGDTAIEELPTAETDTNLRLAPDGSGGVEFVAGGGGASAFTDLTDVPNAYASGDAGKLVKVNATEDGLEFVAAGAGDGDVVGPEGATDGNLAVFDGATGKILKDGGAPSGGSGIPVNGWISADAMTYAAADDPTYTMTCTGDQTTKYQAGQRIKLTQATGGTKYFIVTKVEAGETDTTLTLYGGTDYNLENEAISNPYYSPVKAPFGFPLDPAKWTVELADTTLRSLGSAPSLNTWYNLATLSITIPIGAWAVSFEASLETRIASAGGLYPAIALSTANNSASDADLHVRTSASSVTILAHEFYRHKFLTLTSKTVYYLNERVENGDSTVLYLRGDVCKTLVRAVCAYL